MATSKNAIKILEFFGYGDEIITKANSMVLEYEKMNKWTI